MLNLGQLFLGPNCLHCENKKSYDTLIKINSTDSYEFKCYEVEDFRSTIINNNVATLKVIIRDYKPLFDKYSHLEFIDYDVEVRYNNIIIYSKPKHKCEGDIQYKYQIMGKIMSALDVNIESS
jgi:hypothetical protein